MKFIIFSPDDSCCGVNGLTACRNCVDCYHTHQLDFDCYFNNECNPYQYDCINPEKMSNAIYPNQVYLLENYEFKLFEDKQMEEDLIFMKFILIDQFGHRNYIFTSYYDGYREFRHNKFNNTVLQIF